MSKLAELRAKLQNIESRRSGNNNSGGPSENYAFWNIPENSTAKVRFLPDTNPDNTFFWIEKNMIRLTFPGIAGHDENKEVIVQVPCMEMYGKTCPVLTEVRPWWNDDSLKELASKYWVKRSYIFQGLVTDDPTTDAKPESPIRKFAIGPQIFKIIKGSLLDPDFENIPTDFVNGTDFSITKSSKGGYADYSTSKWSRKETALTQDQLDMLDKHQPKDLRDHLPKEPTPEALAVIFEMFEASVEGELFDPAKWAKFYRPYGFEYDRASAPASPVKVAASPSASAPVVTTAPVETASAPVDTPVASPESADTGKSAQDILALIRSRNNA